MCKTFGMLTLLKYLMDQGGIRGYGISWILKEHLIFPFLGLMSRAMGIPQRVGRNPFTAEPKIFTAYRHAEGTR